MTVTQRFCQKMSWRLTREGQEAMQAEDMTGYLSPSVMTSQSPYSAAQSRGDRVIPNFLDQAEKETKSTSSSIGSSWSRRGQPARL